MTYLFTVSVDCADGRVDVFLAERLREEGVTRSHVKSLVEAERVFVNDKAIKKAGIILKPSDEIRVEADSVALVAEPEEIPLDIVYEDGHFVVINKAQGMVVHPARGSRNGTLVNALLAHSISLSKVNGDNIRPGIVHRLDKDTSGLIMAAKTDKAHLSLSRQIAEKTAVRRYIALIDGVLKSDGGTVETNIARDPKNRLRMAVAASGKRAVTLYKVIKRFKGYTLVEFELKTGRTHQIRVHARHLGHPVTGDKIYGGSQSLKADGQLLHAATLTVEHPESGKKMKFEAALPDYFTKALKLLETSVTSYTER